jgi:hypothetical protein
MVPPPLAIKKPGFAGRAFCFIGTLNQVAMAHPGNPE